MKVIIDLDRLLKEGKISQAEFDKFSQFAARSTTSLAFNILIGFGVIAVSAGLIALLPTPGTVTVLGLAVSSAGIGLSYTRLTQWMLLANICVLVGALLFAGGVIWAGQGSVSSFLLVAVVFAGAGILARSSLLTVLAVLSLSSSIGTRTGYLHATYFLGMKEPTLTILLFTIASIAIYQLSKRLSPDYERLALAASRTGVLLVNFGFWIGSLWGDRIEAGELFIADWAFSVLWAMALLATGVWAWWRNRRWLVNTVAVFAGIHFYTQWFERLGASAETVLIAGLLALALAVGLRMLNARLSSRA